MDEFIETFNITISQEDLNSSKRLDKFLSEKLSNLSRTYIKKLAEDGMISILLDDKELPIELKKMPPLYSQVFVNIPEPVDSEIMPEDIALDIVFEDEYLIIVNKAAGMVTHPAPGNYTGTLVNAILAHCPDLKGIGDVKRPGIVHRLDKGTTGLMVIAKDKLTMDGLVKLFSVHDITRKYEALVIGKNINQQGVFKSLIGRHPNQRLKMTSKVISGKESITYYKLIKQHTSFAHVELTLETGRTHQIRVHMSELAKAPLLCDYTYGNPSQQLQRIPQEVSSILKGYMHPLLHAKTLGFVHPITKQNLLFEKQAPSPFCDILKWMNKE